MMFVTALVAYPVAADFVARAFHGESRGGVPTSREYEVIVPGIYQAATVVWCVVLAIFVVWSGIVSYQIAERE